MRGRDFALLKITQQTWQQVEIRGSDMEMKMNRNKGNVHKGGEEEANREERSEITNCSQVIQ